MHTHVTGWQAGPYTSLAAMEAAHADESNIITQITGSMHNATGGEAQLLDLLCQHLAVALL